MDVADLITVNQLWRKVYRYIAAQVMQSYGRSGGDVLELGSFSGGISFELAKSHPELKLTIAAESFDYLRHLQTEILSRGLANCIRLSETPLERLSFSEDQFDLVVMRGAFFFILDQQQTVSEIYRVLKPCGLAFVGGGYGKDTPQSLIDEIAEESRILNDRLGRRRVSIEDLRKLLGRAGLADKTCIMEEGGVWLEIRK